MGSVRVISQRAKRIANPFLAGMLWVGLAMLCTGMRDAAGALLLVWWPTGVVVACLQTTRRRDWPLALAIMGPFIIGWVLFYGRPLPTALGYASSTLTEAWLCVTLCARILGEGNRLPRTLGQIAGMFAVALIACAVGTAIAYPFFIEQSLAEAAWWYLANVIAMLAVAPVLVALCRALSRGEQTLPKGMTVEFVLSATALVGFSLVILQVKGLLLMPVMVGMIILASVRYGQIGTVVAVLALAMGATLTSLGGQQLAAFDGLPRATSGLVLQHWMLLMLAISLPICAMLMRREELEAKLRQRNRELRQNVTIFDLAEDLAGVGRWRYDLRTGRQEWSERMLEMNGLDRSLAPDPGDVRALLPDGGQELFDRIARHRDDWEPYSFNYRVHPEDKTERTLRISILNEFDAAGERIALFAVAIDVPDHVRREEALDKARGRAVKLAAEAQVLANTDPLTGLPNRRCSLERLRAAVENARESGRPLCVVMFDIDHFKQVNDGHGHQTGDDVLVHVAEIARQQVRGTDLVGRIGGEEFVWLIPGVGMTEAHQLAERLRSAIAAGSGLPGLPAVTTSIGLDNLRPGDDAEGILKRADLALYAAKEAGRNRVRLAA